MDLRQLEMFRAVFASASITRAAEQLHVTPAAVSLQMKSLSEEMQTDLFVWTGKQFVPTPAGKYLAAGCDRLFAVLDDIHSYFQDSTGTDRRPFVLGTGLTTLLHKMSSSLRGLRRAFPKNEIHIIVDNTERIVNMLKQRTCDLGVVSLPLSDDKIRVTPLFVEEMVIVRPRSSKHRQNLITPAELAKLPLILYPRPANTRLAMDQFLERLGIQPRVVVEIDDTEAIKKLVEAGFGSSILPEDSVRGRSSRFSIARVGNHRLTRTVALATSLSEHPRKLTELVAEFLQARMASKPAP